MLELAATVATAFQFLIGTLKTIVLYLCLYIFQRFQFLIGTLKTDLGKSEVKGAECGFNSS